MFKFRKYTFDSFYGYALLACLVLLVFVEGRREDIVTAIVMVSVFAGIDMYFFGKDKGEDDE